MTIPGNPHAENAVLDGTYFGENVLAEEGITDATIVATAILAHTEATLALAHEQHQRNRLAAITAMSKGITLPPDLEDLTTENHS